MISEDSGHSSPRTSKTPLSSSVSLPVGASKRRFSKVGRKQSNGSVQSSSSSDKSAESVGIRQPAKSKIRWHNHRLSAVFSRSLPGGTREMACTGDQQAVTEDPSELSNHITAPGILKIFGSEICEGANYKSVLATTLSSAKELVKEALERYSLNKAEADAFVLCDVIGCFKDHQWRTECFRVVGDNEKPLLLQSLWKPKEGYARRFEIQRRTSVEEKSSKDKDTVTAGINAQARKLQKIRSRGRSVLLDRRDCGDMMDCGIALWRSLSEMNLVAEGQGPRGSGCGEARRNYKVQSQGKDVESEEAHKAAHCPANEREETESSDDSSTQYSIHPPLDFPYFLLLQGHSYRQDFVIYPLNGKNTVFGRCDEQTHRQNESKASDVLLWADDILLQHCCVWRLDVRPSSEQGQSSRRGGCITVLEPYHGALVRKNGVTISQEAELQSGDIIGLGDHYLFMFKDPTASAMEASPAVSVPCLTVRSGSHRRPSLCKTCVLSLSETPGETCALGKALPCLRDSEGRELVVVYDPEYEPEVLKNIFTMENQRHEAHSLTTSFLLCLCLQRSVTHFQTADLRRLILNAANDVQIAVWEKAKELAAIQPEIANDGSMDTEGLQPLTMEKLIPGLQPLVLWMANSIELLHFIQQEVPLLLHGISQEEEEEEEDCMAVLELRLSSIRSASEEAMTVLEEVIMFTFQQCVYYLTKILYPVLPGLLDSNPFSESGQLQVPEDVGIVLDIFKETLQLLKDCHVHPDTSMQLFTYLFFFINAFLFNLLMERGSGGTFFHWSRGVQIRANLDLLMDWSHGAGLGDIAQGFLLKLSSAINLLAMPKENLLQASWGSLRTEFALLNPAQLHHMLREYNPRRSCPSAWTPSTDEASAALRTSDILESFDNHPPLNLPLNGFFLELKRPINEASLLTELFRLQEFIKSLSVTESEVNMAEPPQLDSPMPMEAKLTKIEVLPKAQLELSHTEIVLPQDADSSCSVGTSGLGSCEAILAQKLRSLELQKKEPDYSGPKRSALDPSCLLTPPNTPQSMELLDSESDQQKLGAQHHHVGNSLDTFKQEEGKSEEDKGEEVFTVELQRGRNGLGLALVNGAETPLKISGIYIKSVIPESPAAMCSRLSPSDRILAVNGLSLVNVDYHIGREIIQKSGDRPRLLVARSKCTSKDMMPNL